MSALLANPISSRCSKPETTCVRCSSGKRRLARIAARLRTTVKKIMEVNPDMHTPEIEPNQVVC